MKKYDSPHLQRIYEQGIRDGADIAKAGLLNYLEERIESLNEIPGVGQKTIEKVVQHFNQKPKD